MSFRQITPETTGLAATMYLDGMCLEQVGRELGFSRGGIKKRLVEIGIEIVTNRRAKEQPKLRNRPTWNAGIKGAQVAWNKGKTKKDTPVLAKMGFQTGKARPNTGRTRFKKGEVGYWNGKQRPNMSGERHHHWSGGPKTKLRAAREVAEYKIWRTAVFKRDNYTCQGCNVVGGRLEADHIKPFSLYPDLRYDVSNGRTLCKPCHYKLGWNYFRNANPRKRVTT